MTSANKSLAGSFLGAALLMGAAGSASAAPGQQLALDVVGPNVNGGKVHRCEEVARRRGFTLTPQAPIRVTLQLNMGFNRLTVASMRRGQVYDAPRPGWGMEQLCEDAMRNAEAAYAAEGQAPVAPPPAPPPPQSVTPTPPEARYVTPPPPASAYVPGPPAISLDVIGPDSNSGKRERCVRVAQKRGFALNPQAPVRVTLVLQSGQNRLQINSARRGEVHNQPKPGWGMEQLCEDAMNQVAIALGHEGAAPVSQQAPPQHAPRPPARGFALGPIPPGADLQPAAKAAADRAVVAWQGAQFELAVQAFREAGRLQNDPQFLFDQAVCEQRLGRSAEALAHTQQFIDRAPQSPYRPYADQLFGELQSALGND